MSKSKKFWSRNRSITINEIQFDRNRRTGAWSAKDGQLQVMPVRQPDPPFNIQSYVCLIQGQRIGETTRLNEAFDLLTAQA